MFNPVYVPPETLEGTDGGGNDVEVTITMDKGALIED